MVGSGVPDSCNHSLGIRERIVQIKRCAWEEIQQTGQPVNIYIYNIWRIDTLGNQHSHGKSTILMASTTKEVWIFHGHLLVYRTVAFLQSFSSHTNLIFRGIFGKSIVGTLQEFLGFPQSCIETASTWSWILEKFEGSKSIRNPILF